MFTFTFQCHCDVYFHHSGTSRGSRHSVQYSMIMLTTWTVTNCSTKIILKLSNTVRHSVTSETEIWLHVLNKKRPLRRFRHVYQMDSNSLARPVMDWTPRDFKRKRECQTVSWTSTIQRDLYLCGVTWQETMDLTTDHLDRRNCTAWCASTAWGRSKC